MQKVNFAVLYTHVSSFILVADRGVIWVSHCKLEITYIYWWDIKEKKTVALKLVLVASSSRRGEQGSTVLHLSSVAGCS